MKKRLSILAAILILSVIVLIAMGIFSSSNKPKIVETRTFSEIPGFSFEYPDFRGWEVKDGVKKVDENEVVIFFNYPKDTLYEIAPQIRIKKMGALAWKELYAGGIKGNQTADSSDNPGKSLTPPSLDKNPGGAYYSFKFDSSLYVKGYQPKPGEWNYLEFYGRDFGVRIELVNHPDRETFAKKVIETFNFEENKSSAQEKDAEAWAMFRAKQFLEMETHNLTLLVQTEKTEHRKFGYVFFFTTAKYLKTKNPDDLVPGIGPVVVEYSGKVFSVSSSVDPAKAIDEYEKQWIKDNTPPQ